MWRFFLILSISLSVTIAEESANPCDALTEDQFFAPNPRGCGMYYYCGDNNIPKPGLCPHDLHFHFVNQSCEFPEDVNCTIDDELWVKTCPGIGITKVPHEYSCSEYSGKELIILRSDFMVLKTICSPSDKNLMLT